ncbi:MAG: formyltransferase family protein [Planctomycetota bacterium]
MMKKLRAVVLYSAGHLGSALVLNRLVEYPEIEIVGIVKAQAIPFTREGVKKLKKHLKKVGWRFGFLLFWQRIVQSLGFLFAYFWPFGGKTVTPGWWLAKRHQIPLFYCGNVNAEASCQFIRAQKPDLLISAYFNQILKKEVIQIPSLGILNIHPGWLPAYRGAMCYFWVLKNGEERAGVSIHWIDEGVDTGPILARREFRLKKGWTQQKVLTFTAILGTRLLHRLLKKLACQEKPHPLPGIEREPTSYYPMPGETDFNNYFAVQRFFRIRDIMGLMAQKLKIPSLRIGLRFLLGIFFILAGAMHFLKTDFYLEIMPPYLPYHKEIVYLSGVFEILGGLGVLVPYTRYWAGIGLILLLLAVFPANIYMTMNQISPPGFSFSPVLLWLRLPFQLIFIIWVWYCIQKEKSP